jgi:lysophospholipase L1-like esterase
MRIRVLLAALAFLVTLLGASPATEAANGLAPRYYVSLGDSLAAGFQPNGVLDRGYADELHRLLAPGHQKLRLVKLGCSGESAASMRLGSLPPEVGFSCGPPGFYRQRYSRGTQLAEAVSFLQRHRGLVDLVTIDVGANDLLSGLGRASIRNNLPVILAELRGAAGPGVPIVGMSYYDPFLAVVWRKTHDLAALRTEMARAAGVNEFMTGLYRQAGVGVADVERAFRLTDTTRTRGTPRNVALECRWTWVCADPPVGPDIHPNSAGYRVIARAFLRALG